MPRIENQISGSLLEIRSPVNHKVSNQWWYASSWAMKCTGNFMVVHCTACIYLEANEGTNLTHDQNLVLVILAIKKHLILYFHYDLYVLPGQ